MDCTLPPVVRPSAVAFHSVAVDGTVTLLVADPRGQTLDDSGTNVPPDPYPAALNDRLAVDLFRVKILPNQAAGASAESLLVAPSGTRKPVPSVLNPLIGPTGLAVDPARPTRCLVCDTGIKDRENAQLAPVLGDPNRDDFLVRAEPARVFEIELGPDDGRATIRPITPTPTSSRRPGLRSSQGYRCRLRGRRGGLPRPGEDGQPRHGGGHPRPTPPHPPLAHLLGRATPRRTRPSWTSRSPISERIVRSELPARVGWNWEFRDDPNRSGPPRPRSSEDPPRTGASAPMSFESIRRVNYASAPSCLTAANLAGDQPGPVPPAPLAAARPPALRPGGARRPGAVRLGRRSVGGRHPRGGPRRPGPDGRPGRRRPRAGGGRRPATQRAPVTVLVPAGAAAGSFVVTVEFAEDTSVPIDPANPGGLQAGRGPAPLSPDVAGRRGRAERSPWVSPTSTPMAR